MTRTVTGGCGSEALRHATMQEPILRTPGQRRDRRSERGGPRA
ncbi:MAG TPA: hypothetical protein PKD10_18885 [Paracoccaceae bacterium]|nr:hypothetical protein [Paracoccaceae bacterium]HMO73508.1 hypothetical protein [Paracoccaceae bacterium]